MPIPADETPSSSLVPEKAQHTPIEADDNEAIAAEENLSEVAKRISLLGKLIIPPASP